MKIKTIGQLLDYVETEEKAIELINYINKQQEVLDKIKEYIENTDDFDIEIFDENSGGCLGTDLSKGAKHILEFLEEIE